MPAWVVFVDGRAGCVESPTHGELLDYAEKIGRVESMHSLPYPCEPRLGEYRSKTPSFCYGRSMCFGRSSCPKDPSCTE